MCSVPPPPPPPPETQELKQNHSPELPSYADLNPVIKLPEICEWALENQESFDLWDAVSKNSVCPQNAPFIYVYTPFKSILQHGPTCGLAALSMLVKNKVTAYEMLEITKAEGYSNKGEMLSCKDMVKLAEKVFGLAGLEDVNCALVNGDLFSHDIIEKLLDGAVLLVPYDADANHSPCLRKGHKAHWCLVSGVILVNEPGDSLDSDPDNVYVLCKHGKSRYLAAWKLQELHNSNKNLVEFSPPRGTDSQLYRLPEGGIGGENGLKDQFVIFNGL